MNSYPASEQRIREIETGRISNAILPMPCDKCSPPAIRLSSSMLIHIRARSPVTSTWGIRSVSCLPRSMILEQLTPPLAKPFFDSPGNRSVKAVHPGTSAWRVVKSHSGTLQDERARRSCGRSGRSQPRK